MNNHLVLPEKIDEIKKFLNMEEIASTANVTRRTVYNVVQRKSTHQGVIAAILQKVEEIRAAVASV